MPKELPSTPKASKSGKSASNSPKTAKKAAQPPVDECLWRASRFGAGKAINKTAAMKLYRLTNADLQGLTFQTEETIVPINGEPTIKPMLLFNEQDVERKAWVKHGGPQGFEDYLKKLCTTWNKKSHKPGEHFPEPASYNEGPSVVIMSLPPGKQSNDPWVMTPNLLRIKGRFPSLWLWEACNEAVSRQYNREERERILDAAVRSLPLYPTRPTTPIASSTSVNALRSVLARAPSTEDMGYGPEGEGLESHEDGCSGEITYYLAEHYLGDLFAALIDVINEHGVGNKGWKNVRWEVYDRYVKCFGGLYYDRDDGCWHDSAKEWLEGRLEPKGLNTLTTRRDEYSDIGKQYNVMLPVLSRGE